MTKDAGFCLVASAMRGGMRLVSVVMGATDDETRMRETQKLFSGGFVISKHKHFLSRISAYKKPVFIMGKKKSSS